MMGPFLLLIGSHVLGDVVLSSSQLAVVKRSATPVRQAGAVFAHSGMHGVLAYVLLLVGYRSMPVSGLLVFGAHFLIDWTRCRYEMGRFGADRLVVDRGQGLVQLMRPGSWPAFFEAPQHRAWLWINLVDQGAHVVSLYLISLAVKPT